MNPSSDSNGKQEVTKRALFFCFLTMGLTSFGGVLPWAHRMLVEQRGWLTEREFTEGLSLGQILPGPNVVNLSIMVGMRFHGAAGALLAFFGLMLAPFAIIILLGVLYARYGYLDVVQHALAGMAAVTAGLVAATAVKMLGKHPKSRRAYATMLAAFIGVGLLALPLLGVLAVLIPASVFLAWYRPHD